MNYVTILGVGFLLFALGVVLGSVWRTRTIYRRAIDAPAAAISDLAETSYLEHGS